MTPSRHAISARRGFTLVEAVIAAGVIGVLVVGSLNVVGAMARARSVAAARGTAQTLAQAMLAEMQAAAYTDPQSPTGALGPEAGELPGAPRTALDDIDDYANLAEKPPRDRAGVALTTHGGLSRQVFVEWITAAGVVSGTDTGIKRIRVRIRRSNTPILEMWSVRSRTWDQWVGGRP